MDKALEKLRLTNVLVAQAFKHKDATWREPSVDSQSYTAMLEGPCLALAKDNDEKNTLLLEAAAQRPITLNLGDRGPAV